MLVLTFGFVHDNVVLATQGVESLDEQFFDMVLADQGVSRSTIKPEQMWDKSKGDNSGQNLYLMMYNEIQDKPLKDAIATISSTVSFTNAIGEEVFFTENEWRDVYIRGRTGVIQERLGGGSLAVNSYYQVMRSYVDKEIEHNSFLAEMKQHASSTEIFVDGDLANSGFDLVADTQIIELILFGSVEESNYDEARSASGLPPIPSAANEEFTSENESLKGSSESISEGESETGSTITGVTFPPADQSFADDTDEFPSTSSESAAVLYNPTGLHPLQCDTDSNIGNAFDDYIAELPGENPFADFVPPSKDEVEDDDSGDTDGTGDDGDRDDRIDGGDDGGGSGDEDSPNPAEDAFDDVEPAPGHDWKQPSLCNDIICIEVEFINNEDGRGTYKANDNCVACHVDFMLANMDLLLSKTLTPSKAPGNLLESGKCKKGFLQITPSLNIYAVKKPIPTPPDDGAIFQSSNPFEDFVREVTEGYNTGNSGKVDRYTRNIVQFSEDRSTSSVFAEIDNATATAQAELNENREMVILQQRIAAKANMHQDVSAKLEEFHTLIGATQQMFRDINSDSCEALRGKKTCE